jgi:hypothetical protein
MSPNTRHEVEALAGATTVLPDEDHDEDLAFSSELAERLAAAGASEVAINAAGGPGTARRLQHACEPGATQAP